MKQNRTVPARVRKAADELIGSGATIVKLENQTQMAIAGPAPES